jgi:hypothetical protein
VVWITGVHRNRPRLIDGREVKDRAHQAGQR